MMARWCPNGLDDFGTDPVAALTLLADGSTRAATPQELAAAQAWAAAADAPVAARAALSDALALADLYPAPTPEETALIDGQVAAALASYRALSGPPADVVSLAAAVVAWRTEVAL